PAERGPELLELTPPAGREKWPEPLDRGARVAVGLLVEGEEGFGSRLAALGLSDGKRLATLPAVKRPVIQEAGRSLFGEASRPKAVHNSKLLHLLLNKEKIEL